MFARGGEGGAYTLSVRESLDRQHVLGGDTGSWVGVRKWLVRPEAPIARQDAERHKTSHPCESDAARDDVFEVLHTDFDTVDGRIVVASSDLMLPAAT
jgi:hypothetical protein